MEEIPDPSADNPQTPFPRICGFCANGAHRGCVSVDGSEFCGCSCDYARHEQPTTHPKPEPELVAYVTGANISLEHPSDLSFEQVKKALITLRDHLQSRLDRQTKCPFFRTTPKPESLKEMAREVASKLFRVGTNEPHADIILSTLQRADAAAREEGLRQATELANSIYRQWFREQAPQWQPLETVDGLISQVDNMVAGLREKLDQARADLDVARGCKPDEFTLVLSSERAAREELRQARAELAHYVAYAGSQPAMSDFQNADQMRQALNEARAENETLRAEAKTFGEWKFKLDEYKTLWERHYQRAIADMEIAQSYWFTAHLNEEADDLRAEVERLKHDLFKRDATISVRSAERDAALAKVEELKKDVLYAQQVLRNNNLQWKPTSLS